MRWPDLEPLAADLPDGVGIERLSPEDIPVLIRRISEWYPDISVGSESAHLDPGYYRDETWLAGTPERDIIPILIRYHREIAGIATLKKDTGALALTGRLMVLAPSLRNLGVGESMVRLSEKIARAMGAQVIHYFATLRHPYTQRLMENCGFVPVGIVPAFDRDEISPGVVRRVSEALYAKVLVSKDEMHPPDPELMTPRVRDLWHFLFG